MQQLLKKTGFPPSYPSHYHQRRSSPQPDTLPSLASDMPRKVHRRSRSEISSGFDDEMLNELNCYESSERNGSRPRHCRSASMGNLDLTEFSSDELEKIMANEMLAKIALVDPKRVKRILANRQSAARSKQRKMHYISELERKVQTLQSEATTLSAQLTLLQRETAGLSSKNNELKIRIRAMDQQAQLKDALNEALTAEVHRLKLANGEGTHLSSSSCQQLSINYIFQQQQQYNSVAKEESSQ